MSILWQTPLCWWKPNPPARVPHQPCGYAAAGPVAYCRRHTERPTLEPMCCLNCCRDRSKWRTYIHLWQHLPSFGLPCCCYMWGYYSGWYNIDSLIDGAQLYQLKLSDYWISIWVIGDLAADLCYKKKHVLPGSFIQRPKKLKHPDLFLFLRLHNLAAL